MITYATVGIDRIQTFLARSRHLWGRRGASEELVRLTATKGSDQAAGIPDKELVVQQVLDNHQAVCVNDQGLDVDGVVSLCSVDDSQDAADEVVRAARELAMRIRDRLPGLTVTVRTITSDRGYAELVSNRQDWESETWYPLASEFPAVRLCDECHTSPAVCTRETHDARTTRLCDDCACRHGDRERWRNPTLRNVEYPSRFAAEAWLLAQLYGETIKDDSEAHTKDFKELGQIERLKTGDDALRGRTHEGNHVALIFADGNGVGALFQRLFGEAAKATAGDAAGTDAAEEPTKGLRDISMKIKQATSQALLSATRAILAEGEKPCPVVPHINGGDDVLVSVAANRAWPFLAGFLDALVGPFEEMGLSMSAGMVICKAEYPLANQVELAEDLMRRAKEHVKGQGWSFAWLDVTHDGPEVEAHGVWTLQDLKDRTEAIEHLRGVMTAHGEAAMGTALAADRASRGVQLAHLARRMAGVTEFLARLQITDPKSVSDEDAAVISDVQSIGRWWR